MEFRSVINIEEKDYWLWICNIKDVWHGSIGKILEEFSSPEELFRSKREDIIKRFEHINIKNKKLVDNILSSINEENVLIKKEKLKKKNINFIYVNEENYPEKFKKMADKPYGFYYKGNIEKINNMTVAIIGARNCTAYGRDMAGKISFELAVNGINVVSGLARGIDSAGHWGCIEAGGVTYAVLGCGVDVCYPRENIELYENVIVSGAIISDYQMGTPPVSWQFPLRNRLISALADKVVVVEAREKSGSLITVNYALEQGKDVYAVPGRVGDALSKGCNRLIRDGAGIAESANDILDDIKFKINKNENIIKNNYSLEKDLEMLYSCVDLFPKSIEQLSDETGMDSVKIVQSLIELQMRNLVEEPAKNYYIRKV